LKEESDYYDGYQPGTSSMSNGNGMKHDVWGNFYKKVNDTKVRLLDDSLRNSWRDTSRPIK